MTSFTRAIGDGAVVAKRNLIKIKRVPDLLVFTTLSPIMFVLLFAYVFGSAIEIPGVSYREFLMAGIFTQTAIFGATITGTGLAQDMQKGIIDRFRSLPMARSAVLIGRTDGSFDPPAIHAPHLAGESLVLTSLDGDAFEDVVIAYRDTGAGPGLACFTADRMGGLLAPVTVAEGVEASHLAAVGDMLGDGSADVLANDVLGDQLVILTGTGLAKEPLRAVLSLPAGLDSAGLGAGDLDNDGFLDLVSSHAHGLIVHTSAR